MSTATAAAPAAKVSAPNKTSPLPGKDEKAWKAENVGPVPEYNANLAVADIVPDPQNRHPGDEDASLLQLADSIMTDGLVQPIEVRPVPRHPRAMVMRHVVEKKEIFRVFPADNVGMDQVLYESPDKKDAERAAAIYRSGAGWQIIAGERRWRAHRINQAATIRAFIKRGADDVQAAVRQAVENSTREDLNPIEEARQMKRLSDLGVPQKEIGKRFGGKSQPVVANTIKLLELPDEVQQLLGAGKLSAAYGQELVRFAPWKKVCTLIATQILKDIDNDWDNWSAKRLRNEELPFAHLLVDKGLAMRIYVGDYPAAGQPSYRMPAELGKQPGFIKSGYSDWTYLLPDDPKAPNLWLPEKAKQDKAREEAKAKQAKKNESARESGKLTAQQKERAAKLEKNKAARAAIDATLAHALLELKDSTKLHTRALAIVCDFVLGSDVADSESIAQALGLKKLPAAVDLGSCGFGEAAADLEKVGAEMAVKLAAAAIMLKEAQDAHRFAGAVPESCSFIAGAAAKKAVANSVQVIVKAKGGDYKAKAGNAEASATSGAEHAAKAAAAKHFATNSAFIDLHQVQEGDETGVEKWIFTATKAEKGGKAK
jgi:ParB/RepB/Spo0J family partition protein